MKRTFATLGVMGLGLIGLAAPALAADKIIICHATSSETNPYEVIEVSVNALNGHDADTGDIIPPNSLLPVGRNWTASGIATHLNNCVPVPPVVDPPIVVVDPPVVVVDPPTVVDPPVVVVDPPTVVDPVGVETPVQSPVVVQTPVTTVTPTVQTPAGTGAVAVSQGTNQGFNAQTAVGGTDSAPTWLAGLGVMLGAGAVVALRRRSLEAQAD